MTSLSLDVTVELGLRLRLILKEPLLVVNHSRLLLNLEGRKRDRVTSTTNLSSTANVLLNAVVANVVLLELLAADLLVLVVREKLDNLELIGCVLKVLILLVLLRADHLAKGGEGLLWLGAVMGSGGVGVGKEAPA